MDPEIADLLEDEDSEFHQKVLSTSLDLLRLSKNHMGSYYQAWDNADLNFRLKRQADEEDVAAGRRKEPTKSTIPFAYPQILTFVAFCMILFNQREYFYTLKGTGPEDQANPDQSGSPERDAQKCLQRDLNKNKWNATLYQLLLNLAKFGLSIAKASWDEQKVVVPMQEKVEGGLSMAGMEVEESYQEVEREKTVFLGNRVESISPYHFYPDTRLPITRFQEGEFCAMEMEFSMTRFSDYEADGLAVGLDKIRDLNSARSVDMDTFYSNCRFRCVSPDTNFGLDAQGSNASAGMMILTEMQRWIRPADFKLEDGSHPFGKSKKAQLFVVWIANWNRVVRIEPIGYLHNQFTYSVGQFNHDQQKVVNEGLAEILEPMETTASWLLNSRIASVRKNVDARMFVDPQSVEWQDIVQRRPVIRMKPTARGTVDNWFKQIQVTDVTQNHMQDISTLWGISQNASGISENMLGQFSAGRRDATQSKAVASGASARMKMVASVVWEVLFGDLGQQMLVNQQDGFTLEEFQKIVGKDADEARFAAFNKRSEGILGSYDFEMFDGTLPSENGYVAQSMQELFLGMMTNPQAYVLLQTEPFRTLLVEIAELRGIRNPTRLLPQKLSASNIESITGAPEAGTGGPAQPTGQPGAAAV